MGLESPCCGAQEVASHSSKKYCSSDQDKSIRGWRSYFNVIIIIYNLRLFSC